MQVENKQPVVPATPFTTEELTRVLTYLADEYHTTLPILLKKLDGVSGNLAELDKAFNGDSCVQWTKEEDQLLNKNSETLKKWKGEEAVNRRKKYLGKK